MDWGWSLISMKRECIHIPYSLFLVPYSLFPFPYSLFPIPCSQDKATGLSGSFVLPLTSAWEEILDSVVTRPSLQSISTSPECRQTFLLSQLRGRHSMGKSQGGVRFNLSQCQSDHSVSSRISASFFSFSFLEVW